MLRNRLIYLGTLVVLCLFWVAYSGYAAGLMLVIALILPVFSWLISLPGALCTRATFHAPDQVTRGSEASIKLQLQQSRLFATGQICGRLRVYDPTAGRTVRLRLQRTDDAFPLDTSHCCQYQCAIRRFRVLDLMGLIPLPVRRPKGLTVTVMPLPQEPPEHPDWAGNTALVNKPFSGNENPYDLRDYRTGDTLKAIHWKKSAALDKTVVRDTLEPADRVAPMWIDWPEDPAGRDEALDQLAWCLIYLKQMNAGAYLQWKDRDGTTRRIYAPQGQLDDLLPQMLRQPAGQRVPLTILQPREVLLSAGIQSGAATEKEASQ